MKRFVYGSASLSLVLLSLPASAVDYCDSEVRSVSPGTLSASGMSAPSDAIVLFDGRDLSQWQGPAGSAAWDVRDGVLTVKKGSGDIQTRQSFQDIQLHLEWRIPTSISGEGQHRGNSGVFLMGRYEIQILDSYRSRTYAEGQAGAVYGQVPPLVNATRAPGEWNVYDVMFTAPRFNGNGTLFSPGRVTVLHNGVLIQNNAEILGATGAWGRPGYYDALASGPIRLQDHPGPGEPVSYRNIWVRDLNTGMSGTAATGAQARGNSAAPGSSGQTLHVVKTKTMQELVADPAARAVLSRCIPELVPSPAILEYVGKMTLEQLKGELDITLTDAKLQRIEAQLAEALGGNSTK
jgi:Domain of Unknown Function (DUF1080)